MKLQLSRKCDRETTSLSDSDELVRRLVDVRNGKSPFAGADIKQARLAGKSKLVKDFFQKDLFFGPHREEFPK